MENKEEFESCGVERFNKVHYNSKLQARVGLKIEQFFGRNAENPGIVALLEILEAGLI